MPVVKKRSMHHQQPANGLYVHFSPPKALNMSTADLRQLVKLGDLEKLEQLILEGQGKKLAGYQFASDPKVKDFIRTVPSLLSKISLLHDAVNSGRLEELRALLEEEPEKKKKLVLAKDEAGVGLLHKAVYYDLKDIYKYLIENFPHAVHQRDSEGRTAYHYVPMCRDKKLIQKLLTNAGADPAACDNHQHSPRYYLEHKEELELPNVNKSNNTSRKSTANKDSLVIKKSNIRIWIHQRNLGHLQGVVWEGHGNQLLVEHSNSPKVRKFIEAVPHIMGLIKDIHCDVQNDDLEALKAHVSPPVPPIVLSAKDSNGLTPLHKAAGLGHLEIADFIVQKYPNCVAAVDCNGRTPLHYAALLKDDGQMFDFLVKAGVDESALDSRQKSAAYYKTRTNELEAKLLHVVPDAPRTAKPSFLSTFDWNLLTAATPVEDLIKKPENYFGNATEREHSKPPPEKLKTESIEKINENGLKENQIDAVKEENNNNESNHKPPIRKINIRKHVKDIKQQSRDRSQSPEKKVSDEGGNISPKKQISPRKQNNSPHKEASPNKINGHLPIHKHKSFEVLEVTENATQKSTEAPTENKYDREHNEEINSKRAPSRQKNETRAPSRPNNETRAPSRQNDDYSTRRAPSRQTTQEREESPRKTRNGSSHRYMESPATGSEGVIEGIVDGVNEVETLNEQGQDVGEDSDGKEKDTDVNVMVEEGNMEQLAAVVLNGDGDKLVGQQSDNTEIQSFLDNVSVYMSKINRIHVAARDGSLRDLQAALDRRKFAIAKDKISPNGASPLHVATIFGNTSIVRYLAGRFPETLQAVDDSGRTPLHYAAVLADNGHYYNLMLHLGADSRMEDKFGNTPEYYLQQRDTLSHRSLLMDFGADETQMDEILSDKDTLGIGNNQVDMPFFRTEEGRYLASSLGDPLIKGLTEVANKRPEDPIAYLATYLYNFARNRNSAGNNRALESRGEIQESQNHRNGILGNETERKQSIIPTTIDVVTLDPDENQDGKGSAFSSTTRDEHGQSMLHFAAARAHGRNALFQLLVETEINVGYRDELYRTARDITVQANVPDNTLEIDRYVIHIATKGDIDKLVELLLDGYDHIIDIADEDSLPIVEAVSNAEQPETVAFLQSILAFEEKRERVHYAIRQNALDEVKNMLADENDTGSGKLLAIGKNSYGRCTLHVAVLCQQEEIVDYLANTFPETLKVGDNLERTALHYAMGVEKMETISRVLIKAGAVRVTKDLKGRQPTYYFMNKSDILRLQEEEETF